MPDQPQKQVKLYGISDVAKLLGKSRQTIHRAVLSGNFPPPRRYGIRPFWTHADLEEVVGPRPHE